MKKNWKKENHEKEILWKFVGEKITWISETSSNSKISLYISLNLFESGIKDIEETFSNNLDLFWKLIKGRNRFFFKRSCPDVFIPNLKLLFSPNNSNNETKELWSPLHINTWGLLFRQSLHLPFKFWREFHHNTFEKRRIFWNKYFN